MMDNDNQLVKMLLEELEETKRGIEQTIEDNGYVRFPNDFTLYNYGKEGELNGQYLCYTPNLPSVLENKLEDIALVSGIGATNAPTMGTLSEIIKIIDVQKKTGIYTHFIVNDLGSINARNISVKKALQLTEQYKTFIRKMGFDEANGEIRTHNDVDHARTFSLTARMIELSDFSNNTEATDTTYDRLRLRGRDLPVLLDHIYTATDVLLPIIKDGKRGIVVICGLDEFYHANIGGIALERISKDPDLKSLVTDGVSIGAIYSRIVSGLHPYFKQSKSIPESSINLSQDEETIRNLIMNASDVNELVILEMIELSSGWERDAIKKAGGAFANRTTSPGAWQDVKAQYVETVFVFKELWESCMPADKSVHDLIFQERSK